ncbi:MAG: hypothetical protein U9O54_07875 [Chloroflexota bacterium]|nr:hypothetical protein [Chloroflexota bacterium]
MLKKNSLFNLGWTLLLLSLFACACQVFPAAQEVETATPALEVATRTPEPASQARANDWLTIKQWATSAEASSEFAVPEWGADQATGAPDAPGCGDYQFSWASAASDGIATLELTYETPVYITEIIIIQSFNPDQVIKVEVLDPDDEFQVIYQKLPEAVGRPCPYHLSLLVDNLDFKSNVIRVTVDQSVLGLGWNEIDAVQLLGVSGE